MNFDLQLLEDEKKTMKIYLQYSHVISKVQYVHAQVKLNQIKMQISSNCCQLSTIVNQARFHH